MEWYGPLLSIIHSFIKEIIMEIGNFRLTGVTPLLMHNNVTTDPLHPLAKAAKKISAVKKKTEEHHLELQWIDFCSGLYHDEKIGPYIPGYAIDAVIREAAKLSKDGTTVKRALQCTVEKCRLEYDGPRSIKGLYDKTFFDRRPVTVNRNKVIRTRPCFPEWSADIQVAYEPSFLNREQVERFIDIAGKMMGLLDYRPTYGKFNSEIIK